MWLKFGAVLGAVNARAILTVIFFLVLTPIAFLHRRIHGDTLNLKDDGPANGSLWKKETTYTTRKTWKSNGRNPRDQGKRGI